MVRVEPFVYQKITAFKERVQMVNKINEIIESLNGVFDENQVKEYVANELLNYYTKEEVDDAIDSIDLSPYATNVRVDNEVETINDRVDKEVETLNNKIDLKQNILSVGDGLELINDVLNLGNWVLDISEDWTKYYDDTTKTMLKDVLIFLVDAGTITYPPIIYNKGLNFGSLTNLYLFAGGTAMTSFIYTLFGNHTNNHKVSFTPNNSSILYYQSVSSGVLRMSTGSSTASKEYYINGYGGNSPKIMLYYRG